MTDQQSRERRHERRAAFAWPAVALETIGAILCTLGVIALDFNHTATLILVVVGAPLLLIGVLLIWWSAQ